MSNPSLYIQTIGRLHVATVHFPIALLLLAGLIEGWRWLRGGKEPSAAGKLCLITGAIAAVLAAAMGWIHKGFSTFGGTSATILWRHQWLGMAAAAVAIAGIVAIAFARSARGLRVYRAIVIVGALLVALTGHLGGSLTHGEGYLTELLWPGSDQRELTIAPTTQTGPVDFVRDVQPILSQTCYECHSVKQKRGNLRLDNKKLALDGGNSGPSIVAGKSTESPLIKRVLGQGGQKRMPIDHPALSETQIQVLVAWVNQGANWPDSASNHADEVHWAYVTPVKPGTPEVKDKAWGKNPVDAFVLARLEKEGLKPSPEADRGTLIRRVSLDLTGLPPTLAEVDAFVNDTSPDAYEKIVDRLLASPRYGERMGVYWLDLVRFGDTLGIHSDTQKNVQPYRDWVINALNKNEPFDQFTIEQLAGDLLPNSTTEQKVASAYNRLLITSEEGGAQPKEYIAKYAADRVRNVSGVWLGATMGCCECHNHKFDPYSQRDFYSMAAFFADVKDNPVGRHGPVAEIAVPNEEQAAKAAVEDKAIAVLQAKLDVTTPELEAAQEEWEKQARRPVVWTALEPTSAASAGKSVLAILPDHSILAGGPLPDKDAYTITASLPAKKVTAIRLEVLPDISLPAGGPGRADNGNFVLTGFTADNGAPITLQHASADFQQEGQLIENSINPGADRERGWAVMPESNKAHVAVAETAEDVSGPGTITIKIDQQFSMVQHLIGRFRLSVTDAPRPVTVAGVTPRIAKLLAIPKQKRNNAQRGAVLTYYRSIAPMLKDVRADLAKHEQAKAAILAAAPKCEVAEAEETPRIVRVLARGNWQDESGEIVAPGVPHFLTQPAGDRRLTRLDLAKWIVSKDNPLTARVFVNRLWMMFYGIGISKSVDDFGVQGERPANAELLDYLSSEFVSSGWDMKRMVRLIVTSSAYRQSSAGSKELRERDPFNRLVARQSPVRLDAEFVRDNALAMANILSTNMGGESSKPYQPDGYWDFLNFPARKYPTDHGAAGHRRGVYTWWQRTFVHPWLLAFDASTREECVAARAKSNTPLQALDLLNDPIFVEAARAFANRVLHEGGSTPGDRIEWAYRVALSRRPTAEEKTVLTGLLEDHLKQYAADPAAAGKLVAIGDEPVAKDANKVELAAWTSVTRTIINLHETVTRF